MTYADTTVVSGNTYVYRVAAQNIAGDSAWSNTATVTATPPVSIPAVPVIVSGTAVRTGTTQTDTITWNAVSGATGYRIQRSQSSTFAMASPLSTWVRRPPTR